MAAIYNDILSMCVFLYQFSRKQTGLGTILGFHRKMFISPRILLKKVGLNYFYFYACKIGIAQLLVICLIILNFKYVYTEYLVFFYLFTSIL